MRVSPSRLGDYAKCPAAFYFKSVLRLRSLATHATTKGTLAHEACEKVFDLPAGQRTPDAAVAFVAPAWAQIRTSDTYAHLVAKGPDYEAELVADAEAAVRSWFGMEDPNRFEPEGRERRMEVDVAGVPLVGVLDRIDRPRFPSGAERVIVSDYKSGKPPQADSRFLGEKFFGMRVYAVMHHALTGETPHQLRLVFLTVGDPSGVLSLPCDGQLIADTTREVAGQWKAIRRNARQGRFEARAQRLCDWCDYQALCPAHNPEIAHVPVSVVVDRYNATLTAATGVDDGSTTPHRDRPTAA